MRDVEFRQYAGQQLALINGSLIKPRSTDGVGGDRVIVVAVAGVADGVAVRRTSLSERSKWCPRSRSGGCWVVRPRGRAAGR